MALLRLLASLLKAVPVLGRLFLRFADDKREQKAQERYEDKLTLIDNAVDKYHRAGLHNDGQVQQLKGVDGAPGVSEGSVPCPGVHKAGTKNDSGTRVSPRKKKAVAKKKSPKKRLAKKKTARKRLKVKAGDTQRITRPKKEK